MPRRIATTAPYATGAVFPQLVPQAIALLSAAFVLLAYGQTARTRATAWADAGALVKSLPTMARTLYPAMPAGARIYVRGLPDHDREVYALRNVTALHFDVDADPAAPPLVDAAAWSNPRLAAILPTDDFPTAVRPDQACRTLFAQYERGGLSWQPVPIASSPACAPLDDPLPPGAVPTDYRFGAALRLTGYALSTTRARPGETIRLDLLWRADAAPGASYKTFVHVVGPTGPPVAQRDAEPYDGRHPTAAWAPATVLHDRQPIALPPNLAPGQYAVMLGWYGTADPARLPAFDRDRPIGDAVRLATLEVAAP